MISELPIRDIPITSEVPMSTDDALAFLRKLGGGTQLVFNQAKIINQIADIVQSVGDSYSTSLRVQGYSVQALIEYLFNHIKSLRRADIATLLTRVVTDKYVDITFGTFRMEYIGVNKCQARRMLGAAADEYVASLGSIHDDSLGKTLENSIQVS